MTLNNKPAIEAHQCWSNLKPANCLAVALIFAASLSTLAGRADAHGKYLYVESNDIRSGKNSIVAYERGKDGGLTLLSGGPFLTGGTGIDNPTNGKLGPNDNDTPIIAGPNGKRLFAVNGNSNTIAVFDIKSNGSLTPVQGSPFSSMGTGPVSLSISGDILLAANRNEDPAQLAALQGAENSSYVSFRIGNNGSLKFLSKIENADGQKSTQIMFSSFNNGLAFGNDFQVDADFDGDGDVSQLFAKEQFVRGRLQSFRLTKDGKLIQSARTALNETANPTPEVPIVPLGIWDHPKKNLVYVGMVTRNQLGVYRYEADGVLTFVSAVPNSGQDICWLRTNKAGTRLYAVNNRVAEQPNSTAFQFTLDDAEEVLYIINQRVNQSDANKSDVGNVLHTFRIIKDGKLKFVSSRGLKDDGVFYRSRPQGVVSVDVK